MVWGLKGVLMEGWPYESVILRCSYQTNRWYDNPCDENCSLDYLILIKGIEKSTDWNNHATIENNYRVIPLLCVFSCLLSYLAVYPFIVKREEQNAPPHTTIKEMFLPLSKQLSNLSLNTLFCKRKLGCLQICHLNLEKRYDFNIITKYVFSKKKKNKAFCRTIGTRRLFRRGKTPVAVSCPILRLSCIM